MKIEVINLNKKYNDNYAVKNASFTIAQGEFVSILGPSGCGKTTTLKLLAGLENDYDGSIKFNKKNIQYEKVEKRNIGFVFQDYAMFEHMTVKKNIMYPLNNIKNLTKEQKELKVIEIAKFIGIEKHLSKYPDEISGGQRQRVAIARTLVKDPDVLLLDEPLANLDAKLRRAMRIEIKRIQKKLNITAIMVTHDQEEALAMSDKIILMNKGKIMQVDTPRNIYNKPNNIWVANFIGEPCMSIFTGLNISGELTGIKIGIRPEDIIISDDGKHKVKIISTQFKGSVIEIIFKFKNEFGTLITSGKDIYLTGDYISVNFIKYIKFDGQGKLFS